LNCIELPIGKPFPGITMEGDTPSSLLSKQYLDAPKDRKVSVVLVDESLNDPLDSSSPAT
jgi:hypothetical protein